MGSGDRDPPQRLLFAFEGCGDLDGQAAPRKNHQHRQPVCRLWRRICFAPFNIQVNALAPGFIETDLTGSMKTTPVYQEVIARTPAGRWAHPDECAGAAVFLASRASDFVTGSTLVVDGGYAIR